MNSHVYRYWLHLGSCAMRADAPYSWLYCVGKADSEFKDCQRYALDEMTRLHEREYHT